MAVPIRHVFGNGPGKPWQTIPPDADGRALSRPGASAGSDAARRSTASPRRWTRSSVSTCAEVVTCGVVYSVTLAEKVRRYNRCPRKRHAWNRMEYDGMKWLHHR